MKGTKKKMQSAVVAEQNAQNNPHLDKIVTALKNDYKPNRIGKSNHQLRVDHTAMIPLERDVWAWKKDGRGNNVEPRLLFRAGWYLSLEENFLVEELMKDEKNQELNAKMQEHLEAQGLPTEKRAASQKDVKVVDGE